MSQHLILQQTGKTNESLGLTLSGLKLTLSELKQEFKSLRNTIAEQGSTFQIFSAPSQILSDKCACIHGEPVPEKARAVMQRVLHQSQVQAQQGRSLQQTQRQKMEVG
ncbi:hypothetical protein [Oculatella sp. LEGE 06141]|uniref:hypothetical protein n=1 Tax=Oculatella sp. LEGE 06141 TaxID=1828648 RepID=UPI0030DB09EF